MKLPPYDPITTKVDTMDAEKVEMTSFVELHIKMPDGRKQRIAFIKCIDKKQ